MSSDSKDIKVDAKSILSALATSTKSGTQSTVVSSLVKSGLVTICNECVGSNLIGHENFSLKESNSKGEKKK